MLNYNDQFVVGSDHAGKDLKQRVISCLREFGYDVEDFGTFSSDSVDYPDYAIKVAKAVKDRKNTKGILICGTGIGICIAANKVSGVRAALCTNAYMAKMSKEHNDSNILVLGANTINDDLKAILESWIKSEFTGGRHIRRLNKISNIEATYLNESRSSKIGFSKNVFVFDHPLIQHKISLLRDKNTNTKEFRELVSETAMLMAYEVTRNVQLKEVEIETPLGTAKTKMISGKKIGIVPILRAGLGMVDGISKILPMIKVGHIGLYRDPQTLMPVEYYCKLPVDAAEREIVVLDPMLATGGSASAAIGFIKDKGIQNIKLMCLIAAKVGVQKILDEHPDVEIYCAAVEDLNDHGYIVPGLGDAGDRLFGTK